MKNHFKYSILIMLCLLISIGSVHAMSNIGTNVQTISFESNPTTSSKSSTSYFTLSAASMYDGDLYSPGNGKVSNTLCPSPAWFMLSGFTTPASPSFTPGWVEIKIKYEWPAGNTGDDTYAIQFDTGSGAWVNLQPAVTFTAGAFSLAIRPWSQLAEPIDNVWDWTDISNLRVRVVFTKVTSWEINKAMYIYECWASVYPLPTPPTSSTTLSVQPPAVMSIQSGQELFIEMYVNQVTDFFGYQFKLYFDTTVLTPTEAFFYWPWTAVAGTDEFDDVNGYVALSRTMVSPVSVGQGFTGNSPICRIYFQVDLPYAKATTKLDISADPYETILTATTGPPYEIPHTQYDGFFSTQTYMSLQPPAMLPPGNPVGTTWHELYPHYSKTWTLTSWEDNGDSILSASDQIDMTNETGWLYWFHVDAVTITIHFTFIAPDTGTGKAEPELPMTEMPTGTPEGTRWHQIYPVYSRWFTITSWTDSGAISGKFDPSDSFDFQYDDEYVEPPGVTPTHWAHLDVVSTDIIISQKPPVPPVPEFPLGIGVLMALAPMIPIIYLWRTRPKRRVTNQ